MKLVLREFVSEWLNFEMSQYVFIAGSGISYDSGLPTGWNFNDQIAKFLSTTEIEYDELRSVITTGYNAEINSLRFEQLMYVIRERIDSNLSILDLFDGSNPNYLHYFLAHAIRCGSKVFTTNYDSLIEEAFSTHNHYYNNASMLNQIYLENEKDEVSSAACNSFERYTKNRSSEPAIFKLHGTLRNIHAERSKDDIPRLSVGATLDRIGTRDGSMRLEPHKHSVLEDAVKGRILCVIGYSGTDDFDVIPSLAEVLHNCNAMLWFRYDDASSSITKHDEQCSAGLLPNSLCGEKTSSISYVINGNTKNNIKKLFRYNMTTGIRKRHNRYSDKHISGYLSSVEPYKSLNNVNKKIISGRIAEEAYRPEIALNRYNDAIDLSKRFMPSAHAYAHFRRGHILRLQGDDIYALESLRRAAKIFRRIGETENITLVLNAIGNVYLVRGNLNKAEIKYNEALILSTHHNNPRFKATVLNNLGLICKKRGDLSGALNYYNNAYSIDEEIREKSGMVRELGNIVNVLMLQKKYGEAIDVCDRISIIQRLLGRLDQLANLFTSRGNILLKLGRIDEAEKAAGEALSIKSILNRIEVNAQCISLLGRIAQAKCDWNLAISHFSESIKLQMQISRPEGAAIDLESLGECCESIGDYTNAIYAYKESAKICKSIGNRHKNKELKEKIKNVMGK